MLLCSGMKTYAWLASLMLGLTLTVSCKKKEKDEPTPQPTSQLEELKGELRTE